MKRNVLAWSMVVVWMGVIFFFSAQPGDTSGALSGGVTAWVFGVVDWMTPFMTLDFESFHSFVRKAAHFFVYAVLGLLMLRALVLSGDDEVFAKRQVVWAWVLSTVYAVFDEVHQLFVPGRSGEVSDVVLDSAGAVAGIAVYVVWRWRRSR